MAGQSRRNEKVESAVRKALDRVDAYISGEVVVLPKPKHRRACETLLDTQAASVRTATLFLMFYWLEDPAWDRDSVPTGARGEYGDKLLCEELTRRNVTLHGPIIAYGENLGWKSNVAAGNVHLLQDNRFNDFLDAVADAAGDTAAVKKLADFLAHRFAESKAEPTALPPVGPEVLTFVRAKELFHRLPAAKSEGYIQQFLIAALLHEFRRRHAIEVRTHRPHAADRYDETAGDIEEWHEGRLIRAYEVTVRDDWKNRISGFKSKMGKHGLSKYVIIAAGINSDSEWAVPAMMAMKLEPFGRDIAIVDITDVINFLCAELTPRNFGPPSSRPSPTSPTASSQGRPSSKSITSTPFVAGWMSQPEMRRTLERRLKDKLEGGSLGVVPAAGATAPRPLDAAAGSRGEARREACEIGPNDRTGAGRNQGLADVSTPALE